MIKAVFDTNILFSATGWRGSPYQCLNLARDKQIALMVCREILAEYQEKLQTKLDMTPGQARRAVAEILACSTAVEIKRELHVVTDDPDDDKVIECAIVSQATHIVSGDHHLLDLKEYAGVVILRANEFLRLVAVEK